MYTKCSETLKNVHILSSQPVVNNNRVIENRSESQTWFVNILDVHFL